MLIRCAWCGRIIGDKPPYGCKHDKKITDGICDDCYRREMREMRHRRKGAKQGCE